MQTYYKVFNPITGTHIDVSTIAEANELRNSLVNEWIASRIEEANIIHSIASITKDDEGNELWVTLESDQV